MIVRNGGTDVGKRIYVCAAEREGLEVRADVYVRAQLYYQERGALVRLGKGRVVVMKCLRYKNAN